MQSRFSAYLTSFLVIILAISLTSCTFILKKGQRNQTANVSKIKNEIATLKNELTDLEKAKIELERRMADEIDNRDVTIENLERGLVITFVAEVLFDSGKAELRKQSFGKLAKVSRIINTVVPDYDIGVEGHTDNVPIRKSGWKSNWELSAARAMSVLRFLQTKEVDPKRLSGTGYGEYRPVSTNDSKAGRQRNRRVEIVILPKVEKQKAKVKK